ncbi:hypothetical protein [Halocatena marina]|uniref:hypothetical protein n=1 Tax=Halocatena marina TaxID=2934937 RepID=UPI002224CAD0|nr:hypothetical protein [Halocatena marina]
MPGEPLKYRRRSLLVGATVGMGSIAGCSLLPDFGKQDTATETANRESRAPTRTPEQIDKPQMVTDAPRWAGSLSARPKTGEQPGHEYFVNQGRQNGALYTWYDGGWHLTDRYVQDASFASINGVRFASRHATEGSGTPDDRWVLENGLLPEGGMVYFDAGNYTSGGLQTPTDTNYEQTAVYLTGAGVRTTSLIDDGTEGSLITFDSEKSGNFGGVSDMGVFGHHPDSDNRSNGHLIHGTGNIIDTIYENLIVRYSWGDGMHLEASTSGTRIRNSWVENNFGWNIYLGGGTRLKLSDLHLVTGKSGGIHLRPSYSQITGVSMVNCSPGIDVKGVTNAISDMYITQSGSGAAIRERDVKKNVFTNITITDSKTGIVTQGTRSQYSNIGVSNATDEAVRLSGTGLSIENLTVSGFAESGSGTPAIDCSGTDCRLTGVSIAQSSNNASRVAAHISGERNVLSNISCHGSQPWQIVVNANAVGTVLDSVRGVTLSSLRDDGRRTLLNRQGTNGGDPRVSGEWNGHGEYANAMGATVWDTKPNPWTPYCADGAGNWIPMSK